MAEIAKTPEDQLQQELKELHEHSCKRCGFDQRQDYTPISEEILQTYFKASLAQVPFTKRYELYNGALSVTFEEASGKLLRLQERAIMDKTKDGLGSISDAADFSMVASLAEVSQQPKEGGERILYKADTARRLKILEDQALPEELLNMPIIQLQALRTTFSQFSALCASLVLAAQDENFWKGVGRN